MNLPTNWTDFCQKYYSEWYSDPYFQTYSVIIQSKNKIPDEFISLLNTRWQMRDQLTINQLPKDHPLKDNKFFGAYMDKLYDLSRPFRKYKLSNYTLVCKKAIETYERPLEAFVKKFNAITRTDTNLNAYYMEIQENYTNRNFILIHLIKFNTQPDQIKTKGREAPPVISSPLPANMSDSEKFQTVKLHVTSSLDLENNFWDNIGDIGSGHEFYDIFDDVWYDIFDDAYTVKIQQINTKHFKFNFTNSSSDNNSSDNNSSENVEKFLYDIGNEIAESIKEVLEENMADRFYSFASWEITYNLKLLNENTMHLSINYATFKNKDYEEDLAEDHFKNYKIPRFPSDYKNNIERTYVKCASMAEEKKRQQERQERQQEKQRSQKRKRVDNHTSYLNNMTREEAMRELGISSTDEATVRRAYIKKARTMHPDKQRSKSESEKEKAKKMMQTLNRAKDILAPRLRYYLYQLKF